VHRSVIESKRFCLSLFKCCKVYRSNQQRHLCFSPFPVRISVSIQGSATFCRQCIGLRGQIIHKYFYTWVKVNFRSVWIVKKLIRKTWSFCVPLEIIWRAKCDTRAVGCGPLLLYSGICEYSTCSNVWSKGAERVWWRPRMLSDARIYRLRVRGRRKTAPRSGVQMGEQLFAWKCPST